MQHIKYNPVMLRYEVIARDIDAEKLQHVQDIARIKESLGEKQFTTREFDKLFKMTSHALDTIVTDQSAVLNRYYHDQRAKKRNENDNN